jgi:phosphoribosylcarboxyaminoimidazole (NCAIR) mutase
MAGTSASMASAVTVSPIPRVNVGSQDNLTVTDAGITVLTVPAGANIAEITIFDSNQTILFRTDGNAPTNVPEMGVPAFQRFELEGSDELTNFQAIAPVGQTLRLYVEYKTDTQPINN